MLSSLVSILFFKRLILNIIGKSKYHLIYFDSLVCLSLIFFKYETVFKLFYYFINCITILIFIIFLMVFSAFSLDISYSLYLENLCLF